MAINENVIPPTINHKTIDPEIDKKLNLTLNKAQEKKSYLCHVKHIWFWRAQCLSTI